MCGNASNFDNIVFNVQVIEFGLSAAPISLALSTSPISELEASSSSSDIDDATSGLLSFGFFHVYYTMLIYILDTTNTVCYFLGSELIQN